ncbi:MAG: SDR family oxidoreductase [Deltaproteobacteria bacterium]|nr:SDR family oxidoreductase [Deltaproteobacteria bacterium]
MKTLSIADTLAGRHLFLIGGTGFLGKVLLSLLVRNVPTIGSITCLVRPGRDGVRAPDRFRRDVWASPVLAPARAALGDAAERFLAERIVVREGDVTLPNLGLSPADAEAVAARCDAVINVAGLVNFSPPLAEAFAVNVRGARHAAQFAAACRHARLVHISTCFVAGARSGEFGEVLPRFAFAREIQALEALLARLPPREATAAWRERARLCGWPNLYTYTKALGERCLAATPSLCYTIVRPAIIESAVQFPEPGWNEGINTSAPLAYLGLLGQARYPCGKDVVLDVIPVDHVAAAIGMITAALLRGVAEPVYQLGSSDTNPLTMAEAVELTGLFKRRFLSTAQSRELAKGLGMPHWLKTLMAQWEAVPVSAEHFRRYSGPAIRAFIDRVLPKLAHVGTRRAWPLRLIARPLAEAGKALRTLAARSEKVFTQYLPFIHDHACRFRCAHIRTLRSRLSAAEAAAWPWAPETIDWRRYWIDVHLAGLARHVFPLMTAQLQGKDGRPLLPHLTFLAPMRLPAGLSMPAIALPAPFCRIAKSWLGTMQHWVYAEFFDTTVMGRGFIPKNRNVLVVANHSSHLDMGLVKYALGKYGRNLRALAAKDYFFRDGIRRVYFEHFTNLLAIDRSADLQESLRPAMESLQRGEVLLMFPEGTRTTTGTMGRFKRGVGYLALAAEIDVLPVYLDGTFTAAPKGRILIPQHRKLTARIGPVVACKDLQAAVFNLAPDEAYRKAARLIEEAVRALAHPRRSEAGKSQDAQPMDMVANPRPS